MSMKLKDLEDLYLDAKGLYYKGTPIMSDWEFDQLEDQLRDLGSSVIDIVGTNHDREINHLSAMLSLQKIQVLDINNLPIDKFNAWVSSTKVYDDTMEVTPKFDGSSCNIIYKDGIFNTALTRGNGKTGTDISDKMSIIVPKKINLLGVVEIRGEVIIKKKTFDDKYAKDYKNPRNFVAGILGRDETSTEILQDFDFIAFEYRVHNTTLYEDYSYGTNPFSKLKENGFVVPEYSLHFNKSEFSEVFFSMQKFRKSSQYGLDGYVIKYSNQYRKSIGETEHHPKWAIAIKFPPLESVTTIKSIVWNIGQSSEFKPIGILEPIELDGTTVSRVALHNIGNIIRNGLFPGAKITVVKSGDIIPIVKDILVPIKNQNPYDHIPHTCSTPECKIEIQGVHVVCTNPDCDSRQIGRLCIGFSSFGIENVGGSTITKIYNAGFKSIIDVFDKTKFNEDNLIKSGLFKKGRALQIIFEAIEKHVPIKMVNVVSALAFKNVGWSTAKQIASMYEGKTPDWSGKSYAAYSPFLNLNSEPQRTIKQFVEILTRNGYKISQEEDVKINANSITFEMTGSPKEFGFKTKDEFIKTVSAKGFIHVGLEKGTKYLITDDLQSDSSKMSKARKLGIEIITYTDAINL